MQLEPGKALPGHRDPPPLPALGLTNGDSNYLNFAGLSNFSSITPMVQCWVLSGFTRS